MDFNLSSIDAASNAMFNGNPTEQKEANDFLVAWQNSTGAEMLAFEILQNPDTSKYSKNSSYSIIRNFVLRRFYINLDQESRLQFRDNALACIAPNLQNSIVTSEMISAIVLISLYEWPENWPAFPFEIYPDKDGDEVSKIKFYIELFNELITQVLQSNLIEPNRRIFLINHLSSLVPEILSIINPALGSDVDVSIFQHAMELFTNLLNISPIENFQNEDILEFILSAFPYDGSKENECYHVSWLKFADKLLLKHPGRQTLLENFSKPILTAANQIENQSTYLSHFIVRFLTKYLDDLVLLGIKENNESGSDEFIQLLSKQFLMTLKSPLLITNEIYDVWWLWLQLFRSDKIDIPNENPDSDPVEVPSPLFEMIPFDEIIGLILYMLELSSIKGFIPQKIVSKSMNAFYRDYTDKINEILISSDPVPQMCFAMGILWGSMEKDKEIEIASNLYSKVLSDKISENFQPATIFAMTFCIRFLEQNADAQNSLSEILSELLKQPNFIEPISHSLNFLASNFPNIFINNNELLLNSLLQGMDDILSFKKDGIRIFKSVCMILMMIKEEEKRNEAFQGLSTSVLVYLNSDEKLLTGLNCLTVQPPESPIFQFVIEKLLSVCPSVFSEDFQDDFIVNSLFMSLSKAFISLPFESIKSIFLELLTNLFQKPYLACQTFSLIEIVRKNYEEVEELFSDLMTNFILPYLGSKLESGTEVKSITDPDSQIQNENFVELDSEFFAMLSEFSPEVFNSQPILEAFLYGIRDMRLDVVKNAIESLIKLVKKIKSLEAIASFMQTFRHDLLHSLLIALFDMLHSTSFSAHVKLLKFFFENSMNIIYKSGVQPENSEDLNLFEQEFCEELGTILSLDLTEQNDLSMLRDLFLKLRIHYLTKNFKDIIKEFMINTNRTTNAGIIEIEEQAEVNNSHNLIEVERQFVDEEDLKIIDFVKYNNNEDNNDDEENDNNNGQQS